MTRILRNPAITNTAPAVGTPMGSDTARGGASLLLLLLVLLLWLALPRRLAEGSAGSPPLAAGACGKGNPLSNHYSCSGLLCTAGQPTDERTALRTLKCRRAGARRRVGGPVAARRPGRPAWRGTATAAPWMLLATRLNFDCMARALRRVLSVWQIGKPGLGRGGAATAFEMIGTVPGMGRATGFRQKRRTQSW